MIKSLFIKNFALVEEVSIQFKQGLNIITGETGAGKSILVNAIAQLCGERSSGDLIRQGTDKAIIEAELIADDLNLEHLAEELAIDLDNQPNIIIRKELNVNGSSRIFVNDSPVTLGRLSRLSDRMIDLHGQHQHQRLVHPENHIEYLDNFGNLTEEADTFARELRIHQKLTQQRDQLKDQQLKAFQTQDMYRYQSEELSKANLDAGELDELKAELKKLSNVEQLHQDGAVLAGTLYNGDINASELLTRAQDNLRALSRLDPQFEPMNENLNSAREAIEEIGRFTEEYLNDLQFDPERMESIHQRIAQLEFLLKKYQKVTVQELIEHHQQINHALADMDQYDDQIKETENKIIQQTARLTDLGSKLSGHRQDIAGQFEEKINTILGQIGMTSARFAVRIQLRQRDGGNFIVKGKTVEADRTGFDDILFEIISNTGEDFRPLHKVASGGEISRIMLALKTVLAEADRTPSLVFDEIDSGISGQVAQSVGKKLNELSRLHQILCVTHLPQIAAFAHQHYKVSKKSEDGRTLVDIRLLDADQRIDELAYLLGGKTLTPQAQENARQLILETQE